MNWSLEKLTSGHTLHSTVCQAQTESDVKSVFLKSADYALAMLIDSITDDAMYCLFEWDETLSSLTITVTDHSKSNDGKNIVNVVFEGLNEAAIEDQTETIKFWLRDHLTTSADFMKYSLVAGFTRNAKSCYKLCVGGLRDSEWLNCSISQCKPYH